MAAARAGNMRQALCPGENWKGPAGAHRPLTRSSSERRTAGAARPQAFWMFFGCMCSLSE